MDWHCRLLSIWFPLVSHVQHWVCMRNLILAERMNMQIDNVKVVCEDWRELNRLALLVHSI